MSWPIPVRTPPAVPLLAAAVIVVVVPLLLSTTPMMAHGQIKGGIPAESSPPGRPRPALASDGDGVHPTPVRSRDSSRKREKRRGLTPISWVDVYDSSADGGYKGGGGSRFSVINGPSVFGGMEEAKEEEEEESRVVGDRGLVKTPVAATGVSGGMDREVGGVDAMEQHVEGGVNERKEEEDEGGLKERVERAVQQYMKERGDVVTYSLRGWAGEAPTVYLHRVLDAPVPDHRGDAVLEGRLAALGWKGSVVVKHVFGVRKLSYEEAGELAEGYGHGSPEIPLQPGLMLQGDRCAGTLGGVVRNGGDTYVLTNQHVAECSRDFDLGGELLAAVENNLQWEKEDAALLSVVDSRTNYSPKLLAKDRAYSLTGDVVDNQKELRHTPVVKSGAKTGLTTGTVVSEGALIDGLPVFMIVGQGDEVIPDKNIVVAKHEIVLSVLKVLYRKDADKELGLWRDSAVKLLQMLPFRVEDEEDSEDAIRDVLEANFSHVDRKLLDLLLDEVLPLAVRHEITVAKREPGSHTPAHSMEAGELATPKVLVVQLSHHARGLVETMLQQLKDDVAVVTTSMFPARASDPKDDYLDADKMDLRDGIGRKDRSRDNGDDGAAKMETEAPKLSSHCGKDFPVFSDVGDSGSLVIDDDGETLGLLTFGRWSLLETVDDVREHFPHCAEPSNPFKITLLREGPAAEGRQSFPFENDIFGFADVTMAVRMNEVMNRIREKLPDAQLVGQKQPAVSQSNFSDRNGESSQRRRENDEVEITEGAEREGKAEVLDPHPIDSPFALDGGKAEELDQLPSAQVDERDAENNGPHKRKREEDVDRHGAPSKTRQRTGL